MNRGGYYNISYDALSVVIADVPATPTNAPVSDAEYTDPTRIRVTYDEPSSGGSVLTNYQIAIDDGLGGGFVTIAGGDVNTHLLVECIISSSEEDGVYLYSIKRGLMYRIKYRAQNVNGWSGWSPVAYVQAARRPDAPTDITVVDSDSTSITLTLGPCLENGGSSLLSYDLYRDDGTLSSNFESIYSGVLPVEYKVTGLTPGL